MSRRPRKPDREGVCARKQRHPTRVAALGAAVALARHTGAVFARLTVYKCGDHWHFGNERWRKR